jgi:hypothetical protein
MIFAQSAILEPWESNRLPRRRVMTFCANERHGRRASIRRRRTTSDQRDHALADSYNYRLSVDLTTEDDRCHYDAATAPRPRKIVADPIGIGVRVGGPYLPLDYCVGAACPAEVSASAG